MKKVFLVSALFLFLGFTSFIAFPRETFAVPPNSFECVPVGPVARCQPNTNTATCLSDYIPNESTCTVYNGDAATCSKAGGACIRKADPTCDGGNGIDTAIGCIPITDTNLFIGFILRWAIGIGGGIAFLLIVYSAFMIMTSQGNPERLKAGQELLTSAIAGLIMLIFSVFILRVIGVDILKLPGFG